MYLPGIKKRDHEWPNVSYYNQITKNFKINIHLPEVNASVLHWALGGNVSNDLASTRYLHLEEERERERER